MNVSLETDPRRRRTTMLGALIVAVLAAVAAGPVPSASAKPAGPAALEYLKAPGCPVAYRTEKAAIYDADEQRRALHWRLKVHNQVLEMQPPIDWTRNPYTSKAFEARLADLAFLDQLLFIYVSSKDVGPERKERALKMALRIVLHWRRRAETGRVNGETWTDRPAARRATFVAFVTRAAACEGMLNRREAKLLLASIREHGRWLRDPAHYRDSNHGLSMDLALAALGRYLPQDGKLARAAARGERRYKRTFFRSFNEAEGVWLEHSMGYYDHAINLVDDYLRTVDPTDSELRGARRGLVTSLAWLTLPDDRMAMFGDTSLDRPQDEVQAEAKGQDGLWVAPTSGYAVVKDRASGAWLGIASSYHSGVHKHSDELSFELFEAGERIVSDTGQYHKDRDEFFKFQRSPSAHSTLVVNGKQLDSEQARPYGSGIEAWGSGDGWHAVWARNPVVFEKQGVGHARLFLYKPGFGLIVADQVVADRSRPYTRYFQLGRKVRARVQGEGLRLSAANFEGALTSFSTVGAGKLDTAEGQRDPLAGWFYPRFREERPRTTAWWRTEGANVDHLATFSLADQDLRASLAGPLGDDTTILLQNPSGAVTGSVRVVRSGTAIAIDAQP
jgi:hypothetical protein